ncbi:MAG: fused MFS/spermidine synthase [Deltaproteobacteria bacterium]|nr:fused MFS/spermidine synthase [Deltaproteobacteria bacterium]
MLRTLVVAVCFFLSGGSGLVFETLWTRKLSLVFGSTTLSVSSVLTAFMGGLALGSWLLGRRLADRVRRPILWYAAVEGLVGAWGLLVPVVVEHVYPHLNRFLWQHFEPGYFAFSFLRFLFVLLLLLPPTTLMGATLPLLARHFVTTDDELRRVGRRVGALYSLNTLGGILGTFAAGFLLLPTVGFAWTNGIASAVNLALCATVLLAFVVLRARGAAPPAPAAGPDAAGDEASAFSIAPGPDEEPYVLGRRARVAALVAFGVSGFAAMNYQVAWNRVLAMVIGSSVYSFTIILLAFLVGIAGGSAIASATLRRMRNPLVWLGLVQLWIGLSSLAGYYLADDYPYLFAWLIDRLGAMEGAGAREGLVRLVAFGVAALAVLPATLGMGATLPLTVRVCATTRAHVGRDVGTVYAVNTVGAILGSFASAFVLVPGLSALARVWFGQGYGLQLTFAFSILLNLGLALTLFLAAPDRRRGTDRPAARIQALRWGAVALIPALVGLLTMLTVLRGWTWDIDRLVVGSFRLAYLRSVLAGERRGELLYLSDGISTTVTVQRWGDHLAMKNNGKVDASTGDDMPTQVMVAGLPLLLHPRGPEGLRVAVVGFASGVTVGTALRFPVARVDAVELEPATIESSWFFREVNLLSYEGGAGPTPSPDFRPLCADPRLRVLSNDGRNFLASTPDRYDVVISEPSNPWITGVANLFTLDHFLAAKQALAPGAVFCQWVQLYEMSVGSVQSILRTFAEAFPNVLVFAASPGSSDLILLGSLDPLPLRIAELRRRLDRDDVAAALAEHRSNVTVADDVPARLLFADRAEVLAFTRGAVINTDDNAFIEFQAPRDLVRYATLDSEIVDRVYALEWDYGRPSLAALRAAGYRLDGTEAAAELHAATEALLRAGRLVWAARLLVEALAPDSGVPFAPDAGQVDDFERILRTAATREARPAAEAFRLLAAALAADDADPRLVAGVAAADAVYGAVWPRPAALTWLLARAEALGHAAELRPRTRFLFDLLRGLLEDEAYRAGLPVASDLPEGWQPLVSSVTEAPVAEALRASLGDDLAQLSKDLRPGSPSPMDTALAWTQSRIRASQGLPVPPDADAHAVRLLMQRVLLVTERKLPGLEPLLAPMSERAIREWRSSLEAAFEPWASDTFVRVLPELTLFDVAVRLPTDPWGAPDRMWSYVRRTRARRALLERGDPWMEEHGPLLPSVAATAKALRPLVPRAAEPTAPPEVPAPTGTRAAAGTTDRAGEPPPAPAPTPTPTPTPDPAARYAEFLSALAAADPTAAATAWERAVTEAGALGGAEAFARAVPPALAALGLAWTELRAGRAATAWERVRPLLDDETLRADRVDLAYFAARALYATGAARDPTRLLELGETVLREELLLTGQLMDRWALAGGEVPPRLLLEGIPALEPPGPGRVPYVPLVSELLVRSWFEDNELSESYDPAGLRDALLAGDDARLDGLLAAAAKASLHRPEPGEWGGTMTDDGALGPFAGLSQGVEALLLFDAILGGRVGEPEPPAAALDAALERFAAGPLPPPRLEQLRTAATFRLLHASWRLGRGDRAPLHALLSEALPGGAPPGSPLARLLAGSAPARYHLARAVLGCNAAGRCELPAAEELHRALALARTVAGGSLVFLWQPELRDPYARLDTTTKELDALVIQGAR